MGNDNHRNELEIPNAQTNPLLAAARVDPNAPMFLDTPNLQRQP